MGGCVGGKGYNTTMMGRYTLGIGLMIHSMDMEG